VDRETMPGEPTEPYTPTFDTSEMRLALDSLQPLAAEPEPEPGIGPLPVPAPSIVVAGAYQYLKRWTFVLMVAAVWIVAAPIGLALYYWWFHSIDKTPSVFVVLLFLTVCMVASLLSAMVQNKPLISALAIGLMSAPLAASGAAAVLHGIYFCDRVSRCLVGLIPY
jgi:hypothetical protein